MSGAGRTFPQLGRKLLGLTPLAQQVVDPTDSVLGTLANSPTGLNVTYAQLIQAAFEPPWWNFPGTVTNGFTIMESNFSLFWGLAVMLYEATLVSDQTPLDQFLAGNTAALTRKCCPHPNQQAGFRCTSATDGATSATGGRNSPRPRSARRAAMPHRLL